MRFIKHSLSLIIGLFLVTATAVGQGNMQRPQPANPDSISQQELQQFVNVTDSFTTVQKQTQAEVQQMVEDQGMKFARFQKIMMSRQNPQAAGSLDVSDEENQKIKEMQPDLMKINQQTRQKFMSIIQSEGLTPQRFQQILQAARTNPELTQRIQKIQQDSTSNN